jgi:hypothetical protein
MDKKLIENKLDKLFKKVKPIFGDLELKKYSKSNFVGYNYKYAPRGKSHHWLSFGIEHDDNPEFWLLMGALKEKEDFEPIRAKLQKVKDQFGLEELKKKGEWFIRLGIPIKSWEQKEIEKALKEYVVIFQKSFERLNGSGLLGVDAFSVKSEKKIEHNTSKARISPKKEITKKIAIEKEDLEDLKRQLANCKMHLEHVNENYAEMKQSFEQTIELFSKESTSLAKKYDNGGVKGIRIEDIKKAISDIKINPKTNAPVKSNQTKEEKNTGYIYRVIVKITLKEVDDPLFDEVVLPKLRRYDLPLRFNRSKTYYPHISLDRKKRVSKALALELLRGNKNAVGYALRIPASNEFFKVEIIDVDLLTD